MRFHSSDQAVRFAFNVSARQEYARTDLLSVKSTSKDSLTSSDLHAQAAIIMSSVNKLRRIERDILVSLYSKGRERSDAIRSLSELLYPQVSGTFDSAQDLSLIIAHLVTKRPSIRAIAADRGVSYRKVCAWRSAVARAWVPEFVSALHCLQDRLERGGMLFD